MRESDAAGPLELLCDILSNRPSAVVCDIDGTLSRIAPTPHEAVADCAARFSWEANAAVLAEFYEGLVAA